MEEFSINVFIVILILVVGYLKVSRVNQNAPRKGPASYPRRPRPQVPPSMSPASRQKPPADLIDLLQDIASRTAAPPPVRPVLRRNPHAERSDYGTSPLERQQPPKSTPLGALLDQALLTGSAPDPAPEEARSLPLEPCQSAPQPQAAPVAAISDNRALATHSLAQAFPAALKLAKDSRPGIHHPVTVQARGRRNVRQAILMSEVISRPRAFDL